MFIFSTFLIISFSVIGSDATPQPNYFTYSKILINLMVFLDQ